MQPGESGNDDYDEFSLPTGPGFIEDILELGACRLISDAQFDRRGPKCFSCNEMECQSGLGWRQAKVTPQQINGLVHELGPRLIETAYCWCRFLVAVPLSTDLFNCAKDLFVAATMAVCLLGPALPTAFWSIIVQRKSNNAAVNPHGGSSDERTIAHT